MLSNLLPLPLALLLCSQLLKQVKMERLPRELFLNIFSSVGKEKVRQTICARGMQQQVPGFAIFDAGISVYTTPD